MEYDVLRLNNSDYQPEPWQPLHSLTWGKMMAWDLGNNKLGAEVQRAILLNTLTPQQVSEIVPPYPSDHPLIVPGFELQSARIPEQAESPLVLAGNPGLEASFEVVARRIERLASLSGLDGGGIGSNNWVIGGGRTASGKPILANDPHLSVQIPPIWYEVGLHCISISQECPYDVTGFSFASVPGVVIGHNARIAWGYTNVGPDVIDLYIEKLNLQNPNQYEVNGAWLEMEQVRDTIQVAGGEPVEIVARYTRHGPVISDSYGALEGFADQAGIDQPQSYAFAMHWTALEPNQLFQAILGFNRARNWDEFRQAARYFAVPSQNLVYADVDGNIGYQTPGWIPVRKDGHDGRLPVPGWMDDYEWQGYIPFEQLPYAYNPPQGYIVTANNAVVGTDYHTSSAMSGIGASVPSASWT
jgi:penicillin amidase